MYTKGLLRCRSSGYVRLVCPLEFCYECAKKMWCMLLAPLYDRFIPRASTTEATKNGAIRQREARDSWRGAPRDARYCSGVEPKKKKNYGNLKTETFRVLDVAYVQGGAYLFKNVGGPRATRLTAWLCMLSDIDG